MALLDLGRSDDRHVSERLSSEPVIWLGTVRDDGRPHTVPVWFTWDDPTVLCFSMPRTAKVRDMHNSSLVSLALDSAQGGQDIVLGEGRAELVGDADSRLGRLEDRFRAKYAPSLGATDFKEWRSTFSQPVLVHVERIIAWTRTTGGVAYRVVP